MSTLETMSDDGSDNTAPPDMPPDMSPDMFLLESMFETGDDPTMDFASGSVVFSISDVRFKVRMKRICTYQDILVLTILEIPKALLQQHSEVFSAMLDMDPDSDEQAIELTDSLNGFRQFRAVLFTSVRFLYPFELRSNDQFSGNPGLLNRVYSVRGRTRLTYMISSISLLYLTNTVLAQ
jgi:hypothetical protein